MCFAGAAGSVGSGWAPGAANPGTAVAEASESSVSWAAADLGCLAARLAGVVAVPVVLVAVAELLD